MRVPFAVVVCSLVRLASFLLVAALVAPKLGAQGIGDLAKGERAIEAAAAAVDRLIAQLESLRTEADRTLVVLEEAKKGASGAKRMDAVMEIGALEEAARKLREQVEEQLAKISRIDLHGAGAKGHLLEVLRARIAEVLAKPGPKAQAKSLRRLRSDLGDSPYISLLDYHLGEALREQAKTERDHGRTSQAVIKYRQAVQSYENAIVKDVRHDIRDVVGTSLRASALCRCIQVEAALYLAYADKARRLGDGQAAKHARDFAMSATARFNDLKKNHSQDRLADGQSSPVGEVMRDVERMKQDLRRGRGR